MPFHQIDEIAKTDSALASSFWANICVYGVSATRDREQFLWFEGKVGCFIVCSGLIVMVGDVYASEAQVSL